MLDIVRDPDTEVAPSAIKTPRKSAFTDRYLSSLKPRSERYAVLDPSRKGLLLRVSPAGSKTFCFRYAREGVVRFLTIGTCPTTTLRMAYEAHAELIKQLNRGEEPSLKKNESVPGQLATRRDQGPTVGDLAEEFLKRYVYRERKRPEDAARTIEHDILRHWRHRPARLITRREGVLLLDKVVDRGAPVMANRVAALLVQMFSFAVARGILDATPFTSMPRPGGTEKSRKRRLTETEVCQFWRRLTRARLSFEVRTALKLILVTAQRPGEVALAAWSEFDLERRLWTIPAERSKNGEPHEVPLNDLAMTLLRRLIRRYGRGQFILPSRCWRARGSVPLTVRALSQGLRENACLRLFFVIVGSVKYWTDESHYPHACHFVILHKSRVRNSAPASVHFLAATPSAAPVCAFLQRTARHTRRCELTRFAVLRAICVFEPISRCVRHV